MDRIAAVGRRPSAVKDGHKQSNTTDRFAFFLSAVT